MPGHLFEGNPVDEDTKRWVTDTPVHMCVCLGRQAGWPDACFLPGLPCKHSFKERVLGIEIHFSKKQQIKPSAHKTEIAQCDLFMRRKEPEQLLLSRVTKGPE